MKRKLFQRTTEKVPVLVIAAVLIAGTALAGCNNSSSDDGEESMTVVTEDSANLQDLRDEGETVSAAAEEPASSEGTISYDVNALSKDQQTMLGPMGALIYAYEDSGYVLPTWANAGWRAVSELFNYWGRDYVDGSGRVTGDVSEIWISEDFLREAASVLFPDYDRSLPTANDASAETSGLQPEENGYYPFRFSDRGEGTEDFSITSWTKQEDGTCEVTVLATGYWGGTATYQFTLAPNDDTTEADPIFIYDVTGMKKMSENPAQEEGAYLLPDSDSRYYTEDELRDLSEDQLRLARNEIYARHGRKFDAADLQSYFNGQSWYQGTIDPSDFNDDMLNEYEKANIQTIEGLESGSSTASTASADTWQGAYTAYIQNLSKDDEGLSAHKYALIYVDADAIPELFVAGTSEAEGDRVCTISGNNQVVEFNLARCGGMSYVPESGRFFNWYSHMGDNWIEYYQLENGTFSTIDAEYCGWANGEEIPEDEFYEKWGDIIDFQSVVNPWDSLSSADEMINRLNG